VSAVIAALFQDDFIDAARRDVQRPRQRVLRQATGFHKFFTENFPRMNRRQFVRFHNRSMVVHNFHVKRILTLPAEANPPLVVHADAVLAFAVVFQGFQMVAIRDTQIIQASRLIQQQQFPPCHALNLPRQSSGRFIIE
jgi:hypothetical protein